MFEDTQSSGMIKSILKSLNKSRKLKKISLKLSSPCDKSDILKMLSQSKERDIHIQELINLSRSDSSNESLLKYQNISDETLIEIYGKLCLFGAGVFTRGHFVAASSLVYTATLEFILTFFMDGKFVVNGEDEYNSTILIANRLIKYFEDGEIGSIL